MGGGEEANADERAANEEVRPMAEGGEGEAAAAAAAARFDAIRLRLTPLPTRPRPPVTPGEGARCNTATA